jgi:hypothetical protein
MQEDLQLKHGERQMQELSAAEPSNPQQAPLPGAPPAQRNMLGQPESKSVAEQPESPKKRPT